MSRGGQTRQAVAHGLFFQSSSSAKDMTSIELSWFVLVVQASCRLGGVGSRSGDGDGSHFKQRQSNARKLQKYQRMVSSTPMSRATTLSNSWIRSSTGLAIPLVSTLRRDGS